MSTLRVSQKNRSVIFLPRGFERGDDLLLRADQIDWQYHQCGIGSRSQQRSDARTRPLEGYRLAQYPVSKMLVEIGMTAAADQDLSRAVGARRRNPCD